MYTHPYHAAVVYLHTIKGLTHNILSSHAVYLTTCGKAKVSTIHILGFQH